MTKFRYTDFGGKVRSWRHTLKPPMTQRDLAREVGVSDGFIAHIEIGRTLPGKGTLQALARALGVPELEMFREAGYLSESTPSDEEIITDPELRLFFRDEWQHLSDDDREWFKSFVRMVKEKHRKKKR